MREVVRCGVFETNSSSTHSLSIAHGAEAKDELVVEGGVLRIYPGEFGHGPERYYDAPVKASYCLTWAKNHGGEAALSLLRQVLQEQTGADSVEFVEADDEDYPWGYIDHQSENKCRAAFVDATHLADFIFNPKSMLLIDHDNH